MNCLPCIHFEQDILRLEIGMSQTHFLVHKFDSIENLLSNGLNLLEFKSKVLVHFYEIKKRLAECLEDHARVFVLAMGVHERLVHQNQVILVTSFVF